MDIIQIILFFGGILVVYSQSCEPSQYERCIKKLEEFTNKGSFVFASTEAELLSECFQAKTFMTCITRYETKCLSLEQKKEFQIRFAGPREFISSLCSDDDFKKKYLENAPCLKNSSQELQHCMQKYVRNQNDIHNVAYEDKLHLSCCSFDGYVRCVKMVLELPGGCGQETAEFVENTAIKIGGNFLQNACKEHFETCTGVGYRTVAKSAFGIFIFALITFIVGRL